MRNVKFVIISVFLSIFIILVLGEAMIRIYDHIKGVTPPYTHNLPECIAIPNGYFNFDLEPNLKIMYDSLNPRKFTINRWGFRGPDYDPVKPKGVTRIFCFGGSSTFDPYVSDEGSWSYLIGEKLSQKLGRKVESINAGRYSYTTSEILGLFYHRVLRHEPDLIIVYSTYNDGHSTAPSPYYGRDNAPQYYGNTVLSYLNKHSALFAYFDYRLRFCWPTSDIYKKIIPTYTFLRESPKEHHEFLKDEKRSLDYLGKIYKRNLRTIVLIARDNNVKVLLCTQLVDDKFLRKPERLVTEIVREVGREMDVPVLDFDAFKIDDRKKIELLQTYVHLTPKGCEFVSDRMVEAILKNGLVEK